MNLRKMEKRMFKKYGVKVHATEDARSIFLQGSCGDWQTAVAIGKDFAKRAVGKYVVNDVGPQGFKEPAPYAPKFVDTVLDGEEFDVVIIGGGISGCAVARELSRYKLKILLCEKHGDVARGASGANDGMVHAGIDLKHDCNKLHYVVKGNAMYQDVCRELGVEFERRGQYVVFSSRLIKFFARSYLRRAKKHNIPGVSIISKKQICRIEPQVASYAKGALKIPSTGAVSPYKLTIAYAENAVQNGVKIMLDTAVTAMDVIDGKVCTVTTNRGTVTTKCVINCAGVFADKVAEMAGDRYFSIHPRKGTDVLLDNNAKNLPQNAISLAPTLKTLKQNKNTKGGGIIKTVDGNILLGPDAIETPMREDVSTTSQSVFSVFEKQKQCCPSLNKGSIIAYFSGVRAATYEEDFVIERSAKVHNLVHVAGIQSPGLTAAPAFASDVVDLAVDCLKAEGLDVQPNPVFDPVRKAPVVLKDLSDAERDELIKQNPDYGKIVCRCEQVSLGEIKQAVNNPLGVATIDGVKRRVRAGMGRCQGGFCMPIVLNTIAEQTGASICNVQKGDLGSNVAVEPVKTSLGE
ncbi:MAG: NAD(P)/FAD-dependent oxidoreductase [Corallococcus sp.]|nr:NAD(P)/FAD-dependent oxidoreductase [Corallococcus sp.]MCM1358911.1 NAD(P)/FAD-dependent oxidoreductase [Corallococcus sp.]MCM1394899.1 NAD(P)/FAD-dependent oxidoreductase [Corallococcus sp.]